MQILMMPTVAVLAWLLTAAPGDATIAADLRVGMQLVYASSGRDQPAWTVDMVETGAALKGDADCARVGIRRQAGQTEAPEERLCVEGGTLYTWNEARKEWIAQRPVGAGMELTLSRPNGDTVRYVTGASSEEVIGLRRLRVLATTVTTIDPTGKPKRRLTERYAVTLATATGGRFEVPDSTDPSGWRTEQAFELREIRLP
jgi:hypothetical protein